MERLTEFEINELLQFLGTGQPLPQHWRYRLFPIGYRAPETGKEYRLVYDGKLKREEVLAQTPAAPWQLVREFCTIRPHPDGWRNLLVWGDNLLALRELLNDQQGLDRFGTRGKIKLIYIDPPFATRQDFMKDKEKAYRDKVLGAQFIEFLRRRLFLLRELLADDGSIVVHLDQKKGHYLKAVLDEVFGETNFVNEIVWRRFSSTGSSKAISNKFPINHDSLFWYSKTERYRYVRQYSRYSQSYLERFKFDDNDGRGPYRIDHLKSYSQTKLNELREDNRLVDPKTPGAHFGYKRYLSGLDGIVLDDVWTDIFAINPMAEEKLDYPTQKPEELLERIFRALLPEDGIVLDCFAGSGTTAAVAEKLSRRWIAMDCGKLAIYTTQKRLFSLNTTIGAAKKDDREETERVEDWTEHVRNAPGVLLITEKARKGECDVTLDLLSDLAGLIRKHALIKKGAVLSLICPEDKLQLPKTRLKDAENGPGTKDINVDGVEFRISIITPKANGKKPQPLPAKEFALYRAGVYDMTAIKALPWADYRPFVLKLFDVREHPHARYGFNLDGYISTHSALVWNYPDHKTLTLDYGYIDDLHRTLRGKPGERFYVIAPVVSMAFVEDEVTLHQTTYVFFKVPLSVLLRLIERKEPAALKQPANEKDVNEVIDAVGFDFISQPEVVWNTKKENRKDELFADYVVEISEFRAQTLATDPEDFRNFETFSMAMVDLEYDGEVFRLSRVFWGEDVLKAAGGVEKAERLELRIAEHEFKGKQMMVILCDRYGNEKTLLLRKADFAGKLPASAKKPAKRARKAK